MGAPFACISPPSYIIFAWDTEHMVSLLTVLVLSVGYLRTLAILAPELPSVKGTLDAVAKHAPAYGQIGPQVGTVGIHNMGGATF